MMSYHRQWGTTGGCGAETCIRQVGDGREPREGEIEEERVDRGGGPRRPGIERFWKTGAVEGL